MSFYRDHQGKPDTNTLLVLLLVVLLREKRELHLKLHPNPIHNKRNWIFLKWRRRKRREGLYYVLYLQYPVKQNDSRVVAPQIDSEFITRQYIEGYELVYNDGNHHFRLTDMI